MLPSRLLRALLVGLVLLLAGCAEMLDLPVSSEPADTTLDAPVQQGSGFAVAADERIFTLLAFFNGVAGYDLEYGDAFSSARARMREDVAARLAAVDPGEVQRWRKYVERHKRHIYAYHLYTLSLGAPPNFAYIVPTSAFEHPLEQVTLDGFNDVLAAFYSAAGIGELYDETYRAIMEEEAAKYDAQRIQQQIDFVYDYTRLTRADAGDFDLRIIPAPFESHYTAMSLHYKGMLVIVDGPGSNDYGLNTHEYLHPLVGQAMPADLGGQRAAFRRVLDANRDKPTIHGNYAGLQIYVEENLVRALDARIRAALEPDNAALRQHLQEMMRQEAADGLVLVPQFYDALAEFEADPSLTLADFLTRMLAQAGAAQR